jgi:hypothetical protein
MIEANKVNPSFYIAVAWRGEESIEPATQVGLPDLLLIESYTHLAKKHKKSVGIGMPGIKKRIDATRKLGAIERTIYWLGHIRKAGVGPENYHEGHRQIREYRWFVDNRLVEKSAEPVFLWDLRDLANGLHFLTVHAIDTGWNRAAAKVSVTVAR